MQEQIHITDKTEIFEIVQYNEEGVGSFSHGVLTGEQLISAYYLFINTKQEMEEDNEKANL